MVVFRHVGIVGGIMVFGGIGRMVAVVEMVLEFERYGIVVIDGTCVYRNLYLDRLVGLNTG